MSDTNTRIQSQNTNTQIRNANTKTVENSQLSMPECEELGLTNNQRWKDIRDRNI